MSADSKWNALRTNTHLATNSFPPGVPHSIQALDQGLEILLIFSDGNFDAAGTTFMLSDWLAHTPKEVIAKNFQDDISDWDKIPGEQLYIFPGGPFLLFLSST